MIRLAIAAVIAVSLLCVLFVWAACALGSRADYHLEHHIIEAHRKKEDE